MRIICYENSSTTTGKRLFDEIERNFPDDEVKGCRKLSDFAASLLAYHSGKTAFVYVVKDSDDLMDLSAMQSLLMDENVVVVLPEGSAAVEYREFKPACVAYRDNDFSSIKHVLDDLHRAYGNCRSLQARMMKSGLI